MTSMTFANIIKKRQRDWNCPELVTRAISSDGGKKIPFSSPLLNWCTYGGIPRYMYTELFGAPGGGKSSTAIDLVKNALDLFRREHEELESDYRDKISSGKKEYEPLLLDLQDAGPKKAVYIDVENSFDRKWAMTLGIKEADLVSENPALVVISVPNISAEEVLQTVMDIIETDEIGLVVIDSIPALTPKLELEKQIGERTVAALAGCLNVFFKKVIPLLKRYSCTLVTINQIRDNMDNPYVTNTPGGNAPKFYAALRLEFRLGHPVDIYGNELAMNAEDPCGYIINCKIVKQKSAPSDRRMGTYFLMFDSGIRADFDYAKLATGKYGIIKKSGGWFTVSDPYTGEILENEDGTIVKVHGMIKVYEYLRNNTEYYESLKKYITEDLNGEDHLVDINMDCVM